MLGVRSLWKGVGVMTAAARLVLADCEDALRDLEESDSGPMWRRRWVAVLALLRAVGDVLDKVDGRANRRLAEVLKRERKQLAASKPKPQIYWNFIRDERNFVLHEYKFRAFPYARGTGTELAVRSRVSGKMMIAKGNNDHELHITLLLDGPFKGQREVDVVAEAIQWWKAYLDRIDAQR